MVCRRDYRVLLAVMTTRRYYPGKHRIELLVNGVAFALGTFDLRP